MKKIYCILLILLFFYILTFFKTYKVSLDMPLCDNFIDIKSALEYSYGMMIAFSMLDDKTLYDKFQMIRDPYFDKGKLDSIGLDDDKISKVMVKKMTNYFKK